MSDPQPSTSPAECLRAAGLVPTLPRRAIWSAFQGRLDHPTADMVHESADAAHAGISRSTVYRTLEAFVDAGIARRIDHPGVAMRYDPRTSLHHHLVCDGCGAVLDLELDQLAPLEAALPTSQGFTVHEVTLLARGRCRACAQQPTQ